jgi:hypothetical protein
MWDEDDYAIVDEIIRRLLTRRAVGLLGHKDYDHNQSPGPHRGIPGNGESRAEAA